MFSINITNAEYNDRHDNDDRRVTELFFDLSHETALALSEGQYQKKYEDVLSQLGFYDPHEIVPHMELQMECPYGEPFESLGSVSLGIGVETADDVQVLDVVGLIPGRDFDPSIACTLWHNAIQKDNTIQRNTRISYLYRDASNFKQYNEAVISGTFTPEQIETIIGCLEAGEYFIPEQVGLPEKRFDRITDDDHCWFELDRDGFARTNAEADADITAEEVLARFQKAKCNWDDSREFGSNIARQEPER